jgi:N-acetylneuraminic acid mutarotase
VAVKGTHIYTFGGYENVEKCQLKNCEVYSIEKDRWHGNEEVQLNEARSQCSACLFEDNVIFVFGGYNKERGTLSSIERYEISKKRITTIELKMIQPLRRFSTIKISSSKILILGGIGRLSKESDIVYCFDAIDEKGNPCYSMVE